MNPSRRPLIAGNWKMNTSRDQAVALAAAVSAGAAASRAEVVVCPPFPWLVPVAEALAGANVRLGAQDCWPKPNGAYTGGVSVAMLAELASHVIIGHSERRQWWGETDPLVRDKVDAVLDGGLTPILCVGESLDVREGGGANAFVVGQVEAALGQRSAERIAATVVAYEPIWAIGTGVAASSADAETMCTVIRTAVDRLAGVGERVRILYGGSVTAANAAELLGQPNIDGALVGGASLDADAFLTIVRAAAR